MAALFKGVTNFLETVDQKAGEIASRQQQDADHDDDDDEEELEFEEDEEHDGDEQAKPARSGNTERHVVSNTFPVAPAAAAGDKDSTPASSARSAPTSKMISQQAYDKAMGDRDARYLALQEDFDKLQAAKKSLERSLEDVQLRYDNEHQKLVSNTAALEALRRQDDDAQEDREKLREELSRLENELTITHQSADAARRSYLIEADGKKKLEGELHQSQSALAEYKAQTRLLLDNKEQQLQQALARAKQQEPDHREVGQQAEHIRLLERRIESLTASKAAADQLVEAQKVDLDKLINQKDAATSEAARQESELRELSEKLQTTTLELLSVRDLFNNERSAHATTRQFLQDLNEQQDSKTKQKSGQQEPSVTTTETGNNKALVEAQRRAAELAELLLEKQAGLEAKRSESDQWRTRYEVSQQRLREAEMVGSSIVGLAPTNSSGSTSARPSHRSGVSRSLFQMEEGAGGETDDLRRSRFFGSLSNRGPLGRKLTDVAERLDSVSLRTGGVLRRSSVLRVALIVYIAVLHLWVFVAVSVSSSLPDQAKPGSRLP